jgi:membrane protein DedA with SNARE-associated domain
VNPATFVVLFGGQVLSWAGVPALGAATIATAGVLASQGEVRLWTVLVVGTAGAQAGGLLGWWIGRRLGRAGSDRAGRVASRWRASIASGERFAARMGPLMVFFVPALVSGALGMPLRRFALWNLAAAAAWTIGAGLGAYGVGFAVTGGPVVDSLAALLVGVAVVCGIAALFLRRRRQRP